MYPSAWQRKLKDPSYWLNESEVGNIIEQLPDFTRISFDNKGPYLPNLKGSTHKNKIAFASLGTAAKNYKTELAQVLDIKTSSPNLSGVFVPILMGGHFVAVYIRENEIMYFDSFGGQVPKEIQDYADKKNLKLTTNKQKIQTDGSSCGDHVAAFAAVVAKNPNIAAEEIASAVKQEIQSYGNLAKYRDRNILLSLSLFEITLAQKNPAFEKYSKGLNLDPKAKQEIQQHFAELEKVFESEPNVDQLKLKPKQIQVTAKPKNQTPRNSQRIKQAELLSNSVDVFLLPHEDGSNQSKISSLPTEAKSNTPTLLNRLKKWFNSFKEAMGFETIKTVKPTIIPTQEAAPVVAVNPAPISSSSLVSATKRLKAVPPETYFLDVKGVGELVNKDKKFEKAEALFKQFLTTCINDKLNPDDIQDILCKFSAAAIKASEEKTSFQMNNDIAWHQFWQTNLFANCDSPGIYTGKLHAANALLLSVTFSANQEKPQLIQDLYWLATQKIKSLELQAKTASENSPAVIADMKADTNRTLSYT